MAESSFVSPLAPAEPPTLPAIGGVELATVEAGIKYRGRPDVLLCAMAEGTRVAGVFTRSLTASAPVEMCRANLAGGSARALIVNAGNANAFTGRAGVESVRRIATDFAELLECGRDEVFVASTGVIGEPLDARRVTEVRKDLAGRLSDRAWREAAEAIMTTDTFPKAATGRARLDGETVTLNGVAKGSGMIAPHMATMLAFAFTDAALPAPTLQTLLRRATDLSFNNITVDGDTSTSDTVLMFATGAAGVGSDVEDADDPRLEDFGRALNALLLDLAHQVVKDGEGAEKFIAVTVKGAENAAAARRIGLSVANSPLVKTAVAGEDANWGRIVMAVGKSGERADRDRLSIRIGGVRVARDGQRDPDYREDTVVPHMAGREISLEVDVGVGEGEATVWTCDLTHRYIEINADYRS